MQRSAHEVRERGPVVGVTAGPLLPMLPGRTMGVSSSDWLIGCFFATLHVSFLPHQICALAHLDHLALLLSLQALSCFCHYNFRCLAAPVAWCCFVALLPAMPWQLPLQPRILDSTIFATRSSLMVTTV
jgi:hypothetical protein